MGGGANLKVCICMHRRPYASLLKASLLKTISEQTNEAKETQKQEEYLRKGLYKYTIKTNTTPKNENPK